MGVAFAAVVGFLWFTWHEVGRWDPPGENCSFREFLSKQASVEKIRVFRWRGQEYVEVMSPIRSAFLARGPPSYVFDRSGTLVAWTHDKWGVGLSYPGLEQATCVRCLNSVEDALAWFNEDAPDDEPVSSGVSETDGL
jgi:hypothetical protein